MFIIYGFRAVRKAQETRARGIIMLQDGLRPNKLGNREFTPCLTAPNTVAYHEAKISFDLPKKTGLLRANSSRFEYDGPCTESPS